MSIRGIKSAIKTFVQWLAQSPVKIFMMWVVTYLKCILIDNGVMKYKQRYLSYPPKW